MEKPDEATTKKLTPETARRLADSIDQYESRKSELLVMKEANAEAVVSAAMKLLEAQKDFEEVLGVIERELGVER